MYDLRALASGALVFVEPSGSAAPFLCDWLVQVPNGNPEPDEPADCYDIVPCGARFRAHPGYPGVELGAALVCDHGHDRLAIELALAPGGPEWRRETRERYAETGQVLA